MRCEEVADLLLPLAYDDLDAATADHCREHVVSCDACRSELATIHEMQRLLDHVPKRQTQVDLAAVCLRMAREQRRQRAMFRYTAVTAAAATILVALLAARLLSVDIEPGRMVVAWHEADLPATAGRPDEALVDGDAIPGRSSPEQKDRQRRNPDDGSESPLVARARAAQTWPGRHDYLAIRDAALRWGVDALPIVAPAAEAGEASTQSSTYSALRHELLEKPQAPPGAEAPGA